MVHRIAVAFAAAALSAGTLGAAHATMGGATMFSRLDTDKDGSVSREEARAAAGRKYDLIASKNGGHVTTIALGGRVSKPDLDQLHKDAVAGETKPGDVSREQYLDLVDKAFTAAEVTKSNAPSANATLSADDLGSPASKDLIDLLQ